MKSFLAKAAMGSAVALMIVACNNSGEHTPLSVAPKTHDDTISYAIGRLMGKRFKQDSTPINTKVFMAAIEDAMADTSLFTDQVSEAVLTAFGEEMRAKHESGQGSMRPKAAPQDDPQTALAKGQAYMAENAQKSGVKVTASGLQYKVIKMGTGSKPSPANTVKVHYHGSTVDGKVFDSSIDRGQPLDLEMSRIIPGWQEALQLMPVGSKFEIVIPSQLAYGDRGAGDNIGPNQTLLFTVELLSIVK